jgi:hypothetical protein
VEHDDGFLGLSAFIFFRRYVDQGMMAGAIRS